MKNLTFRQVAIVVVAILLLFIAPRLLKVTQIRILNEIAYFSLFAVSFNLLFGYAGLLSFGQAAYFGLGAYTTAILLKRVLKVLETEGFETELVQLAGEPVVAPGATSALTTQRCSSAKQ